MPANLTPMYHKAEREFRRATTPREQLACLEEMLRLLPKHKGTDKLQADIKRKIKEARADVASGQTSRTTAGPSIPRQGCGQILVIGGPNAGKSQLVASLTNASPEVAAYPYTTRSMTPGMMPFEEVRVQLVDTPPVASGSLDPHLLNLVRATDLVVVCVDGSDDDSPQLAAAVVDELIARKTVLAEESQYLGDDLSHLGVRSRIVLTRCQALDASLRLEFFRELADITVPAILFDSDDAKLIDSTRGQLFHSLGLVRVFTKRPGEPVDRSDPYTFSDGATIDDVAARVHKELVSRLRFAKVWSQSGDASGNTVGRDHRIADGDIVELHV